MKDIKKVFIHKLKGFSLAYAVVAVVVTAVALVGLTPVLTRKVGNLSTSMAIKHVKGWYESYNAMEAGAKYCKTCKDKDDKNEPWDKIVYDGTITKEQEGDPGFNPYAEKPEKMVAFERYCKPNKTCGYPKDKWDEGETADETKPHKCKGGKCKFKPTSGVTKFELYAVGGGGASGSAVAQDLSATPEKYRNLVKGKSSTTPESSTIAVSDDMVKADFIDVYKKDISADFYTVGPVLSDSDKNNANKIPNNTQANFQAYPTEARNEEYAKYI